MYLKDEAAFKLENFKIENCSLEFTYDGKLDLELKPEGALFLKDSMFQVIINFTAYQKDSEIPVIKTKLIGFFKFASQISKDDIPEYFYNNSLAILYPYLRAFVSNLSLQANSKLLVLPTMNLSKVGKEFKENIIVVDNE